MNLTPARKPRLFVRVIKLTDALSDAAALIAKWLVLSACLVSAGNAIIRYLFSYSSNGWLEIQWYMFAGIVLFGAAQTLRLNEHVRVDLIYSAVSNRSRLLIDIFGLSLFLLPAVTFLLYLVWPFFIASFESGETSSNAGGLIIWPAKGTLLLGFALLFLQGISELMKRVAALCGLLSIDTTYEAPLQ
jgi:TRAP-type mannitol/chloroaromatic compound transport system permease small subunit